MQSDSDILSTQLILEKKPNSRQESNSYFIEGFELSPEEQSIRDKLLSHIPIIKTKYYRESLLTIVTSLSELQKFSQNLQGKVDSILQAQQTQFVDSYKNHVSKIKKEFEMMNKHVEELQQKIRYYENQGKMSALVKKVFHLEQESAKLYKTLAEKDKKIKDLELTVKVQENEMKRMQGAIKLNAREKSQILWKQQLSKAVSNETPIKLHQMTVFATQLQKKGSFSQSHHESFLEQKGNTFKSFLLANDHSQQSITQHVQHNKSVNIHDPTTQKTKMNSMIQERLSKQNARLKMRNKKLMSFQAKVFNTQNQMQEFFIQCVEQLKKQIKIRKKIDYCSLEDFKKEDKLLLLIKVLSNSQILTYLHERLFKKVSKSKSIESIVQMQTKADNSDLEKSKKLPKINFNLNYQKK